jgi:hypothetical protein
MDGIPKGTYEGLGMGKFKVQEERNLEWQLLSARGG